MTESNVIRMPKRFDYSASAEFNGAVLEKLNNNQGAKQILLDCSNMDYIDSAGIGLLVMAHKKALSFNASLAIINIRPSAREILTLANLQKLIDIQ